MKTQSGVWELLIARMSDGFLLADQTGSVLEANAAYCRATGYSKDELVGRNVRDLEASLDSDQVHQAIERFMEHGSARFVTRHRRKQGGSVGFDVTLVVLEFEGQRLCAAFMRPTGDGKDRLDGELRTRLRTAQRLEAIGRMVGAIAHDFNNLLVPILGCSEIALEQVGPDHPARPAIESLRAAGERSKELTKQVLEFASPRPLHVERVSFRRFLPELKPLLRQALRDDIDLRLELSAVNDEVRADPTQLQQALLNLAINARDAMPQGGSFSLSIQDAPDADFIAIVARDTGIGMDEATLHRAFEPFFTTKPPGKGVGLGLASVQTILLRHGARLSVESQPGEGTRFRILWPRWEGPAGLPGAQAKGDATGLDLSGKTLLVVEDDPHVREMVSSCLERSGARVLACVSGDEALTRSQQHSGAIDVLISDVVLPGMNAQTLYELLLEDRPGLPALFVSGYADMLESRKSNEGAVSFLRKPFSPTELLSSVARLSSGLASV